MIETRTQTSRVTAWPLGLAAGAMLLVMIATLLWCSAEFRDANRTDISNLELAFQTAFKEGAAILLWSAACLLALGSATVALAARHGRRFAAIGVAACVIPCVVFLRHQNAPTSEKLVSACWNNDTAAIERLLEQGVDINLAGMNRMGFGYGRSNGNTPLTAAAERGKADAVSLLIRRGADVNQLDGYGVPPLRRAIESRRPAIVRELLANGAMMTHDQAETIDAEGKPWDALRWTVWCASFGSYAGDYVPIVDVLIEFGAKLETAELLFDVMWSGEPAVARRLAESREVDLANLEMPVLLDLLTALACEDDTALATIVEKAPQLLSGQTLQSDNVSPDKTLSRYQLLTLAAKFGSQYLVNDLLEQGVPAMQKLRLQYFNEKAPLLEAAAWGHTDVAQLLLDHGADAAQKGYAGVTALQLATRGGHEEIVQLLETTKDTNHTKEEKGDEESGED